MRPYSHCVCIAFAKVMSNNINCYLNCTVKNGILSLCYTKHVAVCIDTGAYVRLNIRNTNSADS